MSYLRRKKKPILVILTVGIVVNLIVFTACYYIIELNKKYITDLQNSQHIDVGIVLGAGINKQGKPYDELKARLDSAKQALDQKIVKRLILSGDNRFVDYDEPTAMKKYLEDQGVQSDKLILDYAGRSTYESCERAAKIFGIKQAILFSARSHLPRAIYLCRSFGIEAFGIASGLEANNSWRREPLARVKALYNVYLIGEPTVLGKPISVQ